MISALFHALRPRQWVKNAFVAAPLFFSLRLDDFDLVGITAAAVALFCLVCGCVYVLNDLADVEADRVHPVKRHRPIASGALPVTVARRFLFAAVPVALGLATLLDAWFAAALVAYFVLNVAYSVRLKQVAYVDVSSIAVFFILRVLAGAWAIDVEASPWLLVCTFLLALLLGFGKRAHELATATDARRQRAALARYHPRMLRVLLHGLAAAVVTAYAAYTLSPETVEAFGTHALIYTVPLPLIAILRFIQLTTRSDGADSPTDEMLRDPFFVTVLAVYVVTTGSILY